MLFSEKLNELLEKSKAGHRVVDWHKGARYDTDSLNSDGVIWLNEARIFSSRYLVDHPLGKDIENTICQSKGLKSFYDVKGMLISIKNDKEYLQQKDGIVSSFESKDRSISNREYDVFISHANQDKEELVDELYDSLNKLGIKIFYDKNCLEWGDNWKSKILNGVNASEFAIIVISQNFFGREWTEKELYEFLNRQNENGQKVVLPVLKGITFDVLKNMYPAVADIQCLDSSKYTNDEIALLFAKQLIKRLKGN